MTRHDVIEQAAGLYARAVAEVHDRPPAEAARAAYVPGGPSLSDLTDRIERRQRHADG